MEDCQDAGELGRAIQAGYGATNGADCSSTEGQGKLSTLAAVGVGGHDKVHYHGGNHRVFGVRTQLMIVVLWVMMQMLVEYLNF